MRNNDSASIASEPPTVDAVMLVLTAAVGRFAFSFGHLVAVSVSEWKRYSSRGLQISYWLIFRGIYIAANILCLTTVVVTSTNYLVGAVILLLEADQLFEEATRCGNIHRVVTKTVSQMCLFLVGFLLIGFRIAFPVTMVAVAANTVQRIMSLTPLGLGITCFSVVFYTMSSVFMLRRHLLFFKGDRRATLLNNVEASTSEVSPWRSVKERQSHQHHRLSNAVSLLRRQTGNSKMRCLYGAALTNGCHCRQSRRFRVIVHGRNTLLKFIKVTLGHVGRKNAELPYNITD